MSIQHYLETMKMIQTNFIDYIENEQNDEEYYMNLIQIFEKEKISSNTQELKSLLYLILMVSNNHFRNSNFFEKIEQIINIFQNEIKSTLSNHEIFYLFKRNKRILLYLISNKIIDMDENITKLIFVHCQMYKSTRLSDNMYNGSMSFT